MKLIKLETKFGFHYVNPEYIVSIEDKTDFARICTRIVFVHGNYIDFEMNIDKVLKLINKSQNTIF